MSNEPIPQDTPIQAVRAKITINGVTTNRWSLHQPPLHKVEFGVVCGDQGEDKYYSDATPSGGGWIQISDGRPALNFFKPGKKYYLTFTEAE